MKGYSILKNVSLSQLLDQVKSDREEAEERLKTVMENNVTLLNVSMHYLFIKTWRCRLNITWRVSNFPVGDWRTVAFLNVKNLCAHAGFSDVATVPFFFYCILKLHFCFSLLFSSSHEVRLMSFKIGLMSDKGTVRLEEGDLFKILYHSMFNFMLWYQYLSWFNTFLRKSFEKRFMNKRSRQADVFLNYLEN